MNLRRDLSRLENIVHSLGDLQDEIRENDLNEATIIELIEDRRIAIAYDTFLQGFKDLPKEYQEQIHTRIRDHVNNE